MAHKAENTPGVPVLPPGTCIGDFVLETTIGHGGFSVVYKAHQKKLDREVAVKVLKPQGTRNSITARRFTREINLVKTIEHPNIIRLYDFGETDDGKLWMATELVKGKTLSQILHEQGPLQPARARHVVLQVLSALVEAHDHGIIHRDIKPSNIMVCRKGADLYFAKVLDFGIGKAIADSAADLNDDLSMEGGSGSGTPRYMAPEQFSQEHVGPHTDVYSLGLVLYEMLTATRAVPGSTVYEIVARVCSEPVIFPESFHVAFKDIIYKATRPAYQERYPTALAFYKTIEESIDEKGNDARGTQKKEATPPPVPPVPVVLPKASMPVLEIPEPDSVVSGDALEIEEAASIDIIAEPELEKSPAKPSSSDVVASVDLEDQAEGGADPDPDPDVAPAPEPEQANAPAEDPAEEDRLFDTKESAFIQAELEEGFGQPYKEPFWKNSVIWGVAIGILILITVVAMVGLISSGDNDGYAEEDTAAKAIAQGDDQTDDEADDDEDPGRSGETWGAKDDEEAGADDEGDDGDEGEKDDGGEKDSVADKGGDEVTFAPDDNSGADGGGDTTEPEQELIALDLVSSPEGATVLSGGKTVCEATPCKLEVPPKKAVRLAFKLSGYAVKRVRLQPEAPETVDVTLVRPEKPKTGNKKPPKKDKKKGGSNPFSKIKHH